MNIITRAGKFKTAALAIMLFAIIFSSGCVSIFPQKPVEVEEKTEKEISDVITIEKIEAIPSSPLIAGNPFRLFVKLRNNDKEKTVNFIEAEIYDASVFTVISQNPVVVGSILPQSEQIVSFNLTAPSPERIADVDVDGKIRLRVKYYFQSSTAYDVILVNQQEIEKAQQAGETINLVSNKLIGSGPVRVYPQLVGSMKSVMLPGSNVTIEFVIRNEGRGLLEYNQIRRGYFEVKFPADFTKVTAPVFTMYQLTGTGNAVATGMATLGPYTCPSTSPFAGFKFYYLDCNYPSDILHPEICCKDCAYLASQGFVYSGNIGGREGQSDCDQVCWQLCACPDRLPYKGSGWACCGDAGACGQDATSTGALSQPAGGTAFCPTNEASCWCQKTVCTGSGGGSTPGTTIPGGYTTTVRTTTTTTTTIPTAVNPPIETTKVYFSSSGNVFRNTENPIEIIGKESIPFLFEVLAPGSVDVYRTYTIYASVNYTYELRETVNLKVTPPKNLYSD